MNRRDTIKAALAATSIPIAGAFGVQLPTTQDGFEMVPMVDATILSLEPDDILVLHAKQSISGHTAERLKSLVEERYGIRCMVLDGDLELKVLRPHSQAL